MRRIAKTGLIIAIILLLLTALSGLYQDWLWFSDLGYKQLFLTPLLSKLLVQGVNATVLFIFIAGTLFSIRHAILTYANDRLRKRLRLVNEIDQPIFHLSQKKITIWLLLISLIISIGISFSVGFTGWIETLSFLNATPFEIIDPIFGKDIGFYIFKLPFFDTIYAAFFGPLLILTLLTAIFYVVTGVIRCNSLRFWKLRAIEVNSEARRHLAILISVLFVFKTFGYFLDIFHLLYSRNGHVYGAGYTDLMVTLPALKVLFVICIIGFITSLVSLAFQDERLLTIPVTTVFLGNILLVGIIPLLVQSLFVISNELEKETPYIKNEISMTRIAYGIDKIKEQDYPDITPLTIENLEMQEHTLNNIRLNDPRPLAQTYTQKQGLRLYYKFHDIDIDRYTVNGEYRQVLVSPRELSSDDLDNKAKTFVNLRFKYTHGFGVAASFANAVTSEGLPAFAIKDVPPMSDFPEFQLTEPRIYYGELTDDWVVVNTDFKEFDYPLGSNNAENHYQGSTGIALTPLNKLMLSLRHGTPRFYLANEVNSNSRILLYRNIHKRVQKLVPFLQYDNDPYIVISNGRLKWIMDAYTTSSNFPYSAINTEHHLNYIRNSVKVVIDAYDGTVDFYAVDNDDPILQTYKNIFPGVFKDLDEMPEGLREHLRYPETLFKIQSNVLKNFHMTDPTVFYNKEDAWDIAKELSLVNSEPIYVEPYYTVMELPDSGKPEYVLMLPFTPASSTTNTRNNMVAWMAARMDDEHYGEILLYKFPKNTEIDGPLQIESRINQDPKISEQLALWDQKGSNVIRGNLLALPVAENFLYVEPIYIQSEQDGSIPEMKRVVIAYEDKLVMTETLGQGFVEIFGPDAPQPTTPNQSNDSVSMKEPNSPVPFEENLLDLDSTTKLLEQISELRLMLDELEAQLKVIKEDSPDSETAVSPLELQNH